MSKVIIDLSHHQDPSKINYDELAKHICHAIIRTQYGSKTVDKHYKTHHRELRKRGIPTAAYAWVRGVSENDMRVEAQDFWNRTKDLEPTFWWLDVEEQSMANMRAGVKAYVQELRKLGAKKVGVYIAHHLYKTFNLDMSDFDAVWIPRYGRNDGKPDYDNKPAYPCDVWQYTDKGRLPGYSGYLDLNMIISNKPLSFFTGVTEKMANTTKKEGPFKDVPADFWAADAIRIVRDAGLMSGRADGTFGPNDPVTRAQMASVLARLLDKLQVK